METTNLNGEVVLNLGLSVNQLLNSSFIIKSDKKPLFVIKPVTGKISDFKFFEKNNYFSFKTLIDDKNVYIKRNGLIFPYFTIEDENNTQISEFKPKIDGSGFIKFNENDLYSFSSYEFSTGKASIDKDGENVISFKKVGFLLNLEIKINPKYKDDSNINYLLILGAILVISSNNSILKLFNIETY